MMNIVRLQEIPCSIIHDRGILFTREFWKSLRDVLHIKLKMSIANHSHSDWQTKRVNKVLEDLLRACVLYFGRSWEEHLVEFSYNNSYQSSIGMTPFEILYGRPCIMLVGNRDGLVLGPDLVRETIEKIEIIQGRMKEAQSR